MTGYKKIIENMVEVGVTDYIEKRTADRVYAWPVEGTLKLSTEDRSFGHPMFEIDVTVQYRSFSVRGYVSDYGQVVVSSVYFERDYLKDKDRSDWHAKDNILHKSEFLYGHDLSSFHFDR